MAKTQAINVPDELREQFRKSVEQRDRFILGVAQGHKRLLSDRERRLLKRAAIINSPMEGRGSFFKFLAPLWRALSPEQKDVWKDAAVFSGLSNWQLFISDCAARIRNSLEFPTLPSELWQVRTGRIFIEAPASGILLRQDHPLDYWVLRKVQGAPWKRELVSVRESFGFPIEVQIRYKSDLTATEGAPPYTPPSGDVADFSLSEYTPPAGAADFSFSSSSAIARYFARVWTSYQGQDIYTDVPCEIAPQSDWTLVTASFSGIRGIVIGYSLFIHIEGYRGELFFDNIRAIHSGQNWARDPRCDDVSATFSGGFSVVAPYWVPDDIPDGASFGTVFPPAL